LERQQLEHVTYFSGKVLLYLKNRFGELFKNSKRYYAGNIYKDTPHWRYWKERETHKETQRALLVGMVAGIW
jgi:hypothetical protein